MPGPEGGAMKQIESAVRLLRTVQLALLVSIVLHAAVGQKIAVEPSDVTQWHRIFIALTILLVGIAMFFRLRMVRPAAEALRLRPEDAQMLARWRTGSLISLVLCEAVGLYGFALRVLGGEFSLSAPFYAVAILLMLAWRPRLDVSRPGESGAD
jgi:uncharacterized membrane protein YfcA